MARGRGPFLNDSPDRTEMPRWHCPECLTPTIELKAGVYGCHVCGGMWRPDPRDMEDDFGYNWQILRPGVGVEPEVVRPISRIELLREDE